MLSFFILSCITHFSFPFTSSSSPTVLPSTAQPSVAPTVAVGIITTIAGTGVASYSGDEGLATLAGLNQPNVVTVDSSGTEYNMSIFHTPLIFIHYVGNVYIADTSNHRIRKVAASTGIITTFAGTGTAGFSGDNNAATSAALWSPTGITVDSAGISIRVFHYYLKIIYWSSLGNVYVSDTSNSLVRKVTVSTGIIATIIGTGATTFGGDNGQATSAALYMPLGIAVDSAGNVYIADYLHVRVRKVTISTGIIVTIAGTGTSSYSGDSGPATSATLIRPNGIALDSSGNVYIADTGNQAIRKITVSTGIISTIAGTGSASYSGDGGLAVSAELCNPTGVAIDSSGNKL